MHSDLIVSGCHSEVDLHHNGSMIKMQLSRCYLTMSCGEKTSM